MQNDAAVGQRQPPVENDVAHLGEYVSLMRPQDVAQAHTFGPTLQEWAVNGVPVDCGQQWSEASIRAAVHRGPHASALAPEAMVLLAEDVQYQVNAGFARIVRWDDIKDHIPPQLKISPVAVIPQANRRDRIILDLSFPVRVGTEILQQAVNATTITQSEPRSLAHFGTAMQRILAFMAHAPAEYPIYFSKYDISDGFWRMVVAKGEEWNFAYVLPQPAGNPIRLVVPSALQMGWKESPAYFCAASETARDVAADFAGFNGRLAHLPPHHLERFITRPTSPSIPQPAWDRPTPWAAIEVFVDDFIAMQQDVTRMAHTTRSILHGIEQVFPAPDVTNHEGGRQPISEKKLKRGEANWFVQKDVLGWLLHGEARTVQLTADKADRYKTELKKLLKKTKIPLPRYRRILGRLRFAALCLPAGRALMTPLNRAMRGSPKNVGSGKRSEVHEALGDWLQLIKDLAARPTHVHEVVPTAIDYYGYADACNTGVGGVWLPLHSDLQPFLWRFRWPPDIAQKLATYDGISMADAEMAGTALQVTALECAVADLRHKKAVSFCDNTPAVSWVTRMASRQSRIGGRLIRGMALRARQQQMCLPSSLSIKGEENDMADVVSRSMDARSGTVYSDSDLLLFFNTKFPLPQNRSWKIVTLPVDLTSKIVSTLRGQRLTMAQWTTAGAGEHGATGRASWHNGTDPRTSSTAHLSNLPQSSPPLLSGSAKASTADNVESLRSQWMQLSEPLARPSNWLDTQTPPRSQAAASASFTSAASSKHTVARTRHRNPN